MSLLAFFQRLLQERLGDTSESEFPVIGIHTSIWHPRTTEEALLCPECGHRIAAQHFNKHTLWCWRDEEATNPIVAFIETLEFPSVDEESDTKSVRPNDCNYGDIPFKRLFNPPDLNPEMFSGGF